MPHEPARLPPFEALRNELSTLRASPLVAMSGRRAVLDLVDAYLVATDARLTALESICRKLETHK
jgi:hypothetical protein